MTSPFPWGPRPVDPRAPQRRVKTVNYVGPDDQGNVNVVTSVNGQPPDGDGNVVTLSKIDKFTIDSAAVDTFALTFAAVPDSWNVTCSWDLDDGDDYTIIGSTLTILDAPTVFIGATAAYPKTLQVQYDCIAGTPADPATPPPDVPPATSWSIASNKAVSLAATGIPYLDVGFAVNSVEATISGNMSDSGVGIHASTGNYITAQYDEIGVHDVRILCTRGGIDETLGGTPTSTPDSLTPGDVIKLAVNWATGDTEMFVNGVSVLTGTMSGPQLAAYTGATGVHFRTPNTGATFDGLKVNGTVVDSFNRADASELGTSSSGPAWTQE